MALIKCPDCGKMVSSTADACPKCGCPVGDYIIDIDTDAHRSEIPPQHLKETSADVTFTKTAIVIVIVIVLAVLVALFSKGGSKKTITVNDVSFEMVHVAGGTFTMGATSEQGSDAYSDEEPAHSVSLSSYYIGQTEVTQALWKAVMGNNPSYYEGDNLPVECVSWNDCQEFIRKLNAKTGQTFRLPTEAEWEYAARGGNKSCGYKYSGGNNLGEVAWYGINSGSKTHVVGTKRANELGIYDMSGNVFEWCQDWYGGYSSSSQTNPQGSANGDYRVFRGGGHGFGWQLDESYCRVSNRDDHTPDHHDNSTGFRIVLVP